MQGQDCKLTVDELEAAIYALRCTFGENAHKHSVATHNTRVGALRKLEELLASITVTIKAP